MNSSVKPTRLLGAKLTPVDNGIRCVNWLLENRPQPLRGEYKYAVLQCTDSLVWGVYFDRRWLRADRVDADIRPPRISSLLEARIFGCDHEILIWRTGDFNSIAFAGRVLADAKRLPEPLDRPMLRESRFLGAPMKLSRHFVKRRTQSGQIVVTPIGRSVLIKEYLAVCPETGVLRIAATRFVEILDHA